MLATDGQGGRYWRTVSGGGGGGTDDYTDLTNKPQINGVELSGNKTSAQLNIPTTADIETAVDAWLDENITNPDSPPLDRSLSSASAAAPADIVGGLKSAITGVIEIDGTIEGSAGDYKYLRYSDGKTYSYAYESYVFTFDVGALTDFRYLFTVSSAGFMGLAFYDNADKFISGSGVQAGVSAQTVSIPSNAVYCKATVLSKNDIEVNYNFQETIEDIADLNTGLITTVHTNYSGLTPTTGYYVDCRDGKVSANANMKYIQFQINAGSYIQYNSIIRTPDIRGLAFYNAYGSFIIGYQMLTTAQKISIPSDATLCKVTVNDANDVYLILTPSDIANYADKKETFDILTAFENITCVGDSLTWSQVYLAGGTTRKAHRPWVDILEERTGATTEEIANPGYSASQWWAANESSITSKTNQLAIIYLGTNLGLSDTVDTDCVGNDPTNWGNTLTADYCRIVNAFKSVGAQIILVKPFTTTGNSTAGTTYANTYAAIDSIATRFGCGIVEPIYLADSAYHKYPNGVGENAVHYNDLGYAAFVDKLITGISHMSNAYMVNVVPT